MAFNNALLCTALTTPVRRHGHRLGGIAEHLQADNSILRRENTELKRVIRTRKERSSGKRIILKGRFLVSTEEVQRKLAEAEQVTREKKTRSRNKTRLTRVEEGESDEDSSDDLDIENRVIHECIEVEML